MNPKLLFLFCLAIPLLQGWSKPVLEHRFSFDGAIVDSIAQTEVFVTPNSAYLAAPAFVPQAPHGSGTSLRLGDSHGTKKSGFELDGSAVSMAEGSYSVWIKPTRRALNAARYITAAVQWGPKIYLKGGGTDLGAQAGTSAREDVSAPLSPWDGWHHVALTWDNRTGRYRLFLNGEPVGTGDSEPGAIRAESIRFGAFNFVDKDTVLESQFVGLLHDLQIYSGILNKKDISHLAAHPGSALQP